MRMSWVVESMKEGFIETKNGKVWYCSFSSAKQTVPILVVHGGPGFVSMPQVIEEFSDDHDVYFYDQIGSGKSDRASCNDFYSVENFVDELEEVIKALKFEQVILMGFSWGCALICKYMLCKKPENVKGIILSAPYLSSPRWYADQRENIMNMPEDTRKAIKSMYVVLIRGLTLYSRLLESLIWMFILLCGDPVSLLLRANSKILIFCRSLKG
jgi:proline iminopeptidase